MGTCAGVGASLGLEYPSGVVRGGDSVLALVIYQPCLNVIQREAVNEPARCVNRCAGLVVEDGVLPVVQRVGVTAPRLTQSPPIPVRLAPQSVFRVLRSLMVVSSSRVGDAGEHTRR